MLERGLVVTEPQWKDIVKEEKRHCAHIKKTFQGQVLGYVTPVSLNPDADMSASFLADDQHLMPLLPNPLKDSFRFYPSLS